MQSSFRIVLFGKKKVADGDCKVRGEHKNDTRAIAHETEKQQQKLSLAQDQYQHINILSFGKIVLNIK